MLVACALAACGTPPDSGASTTTLHEGSIGAASADSVAATSSVPPFVEHPGWPANVLAGVPLEPDDGLLIMSPYGILDTTRDHVEPVVGLPDHGEVPVVATLVEGAGDVMVSVHCPMCRDAAEPVVHPLRSGVAGTKVADGFVTAGNEGFWLRTRDGEECELSQIDATGTVLRAGRPIDCALTVREETSLGVLVDTGGGSALLDPDTYERNKLPGRAVAVFSDQALVEHDGDLVLHDPMTDTSTSLTVPDSDGQLGYGRISPEERHVLIVFGHPAWPGPRQLLDLWALDTVTSEWTQLPGMPVAAALKSLAFDWTPDGRVVIVGQFDGVGQTVVTWVPGDDRLHTQPTSLRRTSSIIATPLDGQ